ncbi:hypothetical protein HYC85_031901 [Camellia sinensis]|uniref:Uncharacterized protein n=1 Tax=Camellia sinensis TaxID=4442 RepID=A0A7J7FTM9_CAMSI|nr:hypothetical protein HYC85_031901 [Camellia sinensis]
MIIQIITKFALSRFCFYLFLGNNMKGKNVNLHRCARRTGRGRREMSWILSFWGTEQGSRTSFRPTFTRMELETER